MYIKILLLVTLWCSVSARMGDYRCNDQAALNLHKRPAYEFSMRLLQRVAEDTDSHFVFSPLSTWMQLTALAEGASGTTFKEIWNVTRHHQNNCFKKKLGKILRRLNRDLKRTNRKMSIIAIDQLLAVKKSYIRQVQRYGINVLLLDFYEQVKSTAEVNHAMDEGTGGVITEILYPNDFEQTVLLMSDANYFHCDWSSSFNQAFTTNQSFLSSSNQHLGEVSMMNQIGKFNMLEFPHIGAKILELPCINRAVSMLIFLPTNKTIEYNVGEIFYSLENTTLASIFNAYRRRGEKLVNVSIPRFDQRTEFDNLPELLYDMGIERIFNPNLAEFDHISDYQMYASLMTQISSISVNEKGVTASAQSLTNPASSVEFNANKPFAYMVVHKKTQFILYAGVFSKPSVY